MLSPKIVRSSSVKVIVYRVGQVLLQNVALAQKSIYLFRRSCRRSYTDTRDAPEKRSRSGALFGTATCQHRTHWLSPGGRKGPVEGKRAVRLSNRQFYHPDELPSTVAAAARTIPHAQHERVTAAVKVPTLQAIATSRLEREQYLTVTTKPPRTWE